MIVVSYEIHYRCLNINCGDTVAFEVKRPYKYQDITKVKREIFSQSVCGSCHHGTEISRIKCNVIKDIFGDRFHGQWKCFDHPEVCCYPEPLRRTSEADDWIKDSLSRRCQYRPYLDISKNGFPWKCPECKKPLVYMDDRYK